MTDASIDFLSGRDPLGRDIALNQKLDATVFGIPVRFESNSAAVIDVANEAFGDVRPAVGGEVRRKPLAVRIVVHAGGPNHNGDMSQLRSWSPERTRVILQGPDTVAVADATRGHSIAYVPRALVAQRARFRHEVLEALTLVIVSHHDRQPVHAAAVARDGAAVLLCAPSGTGKSTLAYASYLAGLTVLSDEVAWVQLKPHLAVWGGLARRIHLKPDAQTRFPSLASAEPTELPSGKHKIAVDLGGTANDAPLIAHRLTVCLVGRATSGPSVATRVSAAAIADALTDCPDPGFDRYLRRLRSCARALALGGGWHLAVSNDAESAVPLIVSMLDGIRGGR